MDDTKSQNLPSSQQPQPANAQPQQAQSPIQAQQPSPAPASIPLQSQPVNPGTVQQPTPAVGTQVYQQNSVQQGKPAVSAPPPEVAQRIASWYEPSTDIPAETTPTAVSAPTVPGASQAEPTPPQPATADVTTAPIPPVPSAPVAPWDVPDSPVAPVDTKQQDAPAQSVPQPKAQEDMQQNPLDAKPAAGLLSQEPASQGQGTVPPKPPTPLSPFDEDEHHHNVVPKPLRLILGILAVLVIGFIGVKLISGLFQGSSSGKVTLTYWGLWEDTNVMQSVISDFERENPNIHVNYIKEDPKDYNQRVLTRIHDGNGPDIFRYHVTWLPEMQPSLLPLSKDVLSKDDLTKNYYPFIRNDLVKNGAVYGLPLEIDTLAMFVNTDLFDKAKIEVPSTWDTFITVARGLTEKDASGKIKVAGASIGTFDNITHAPDLVSLLLVQNGVDLSTMSPVQNASDAITFYTSFAKDQTSVWDDTLDPSQLGFARGNVAMYFGYSWDVFAIKAANPNLNFKIYPVPHLPGRETTITSYWAEGVSAKTKHPREAMLFMKYLARKDTLTKLYAEESKTRLFGELYPRMDLASSLKDNSLAAPFIQQAQNAQSSFFAGETHDTGINAQMNGYLGNAIRSVLKDTSPQSALETLTQGVSQVLQQYGQQQQQ